MSKSYNLSKKSDMKKFSKDLEDTIMEIAKDKINNGLEIDYECPKCHKQIKIHVGNNVCPFCKFNIEVSL